MNKQQLLNIVSNPGILENISLKNLQELVDEYPYFQTAHLLLAKKQAGPISTTARELLSRSASVVGDRSIFYHFLKKQYEAADLPEIVIAEPEPEEAEIIEEVVEDTPEVEETVSEENDTILIETDTAPTLQISEDDLPLETVESAPSAELEQTENSADDDAETIVVPKDEITLEDTEETVVVPKTDILVDENQETVVVAKSDINVDEPTDELETEVVELKTTIEEVEEKKEDLHSLYANLVGKSEEKLQQLAEEETVENSVEELVGSDFLKKQEELLEDRQQAEESIHDERLNTEQIDKEALKQLEAELEKMSSNKTESDGPEVEEMSELIQKEVKDIIKKDVEKDLEAMKEQVNLDEKIATELDVTIAEEGDEENHDTTNIEGNKISSDLLKNLKSKVDSYKKKKKKSYESWLSDFSDDDEPKEESGVSNIPPKAIISDEVKQEIQQYVESQGNEMPQKEDKTAEEQAEQSIRDTESIMSETMAKVYTRQGLYDEAIKIYERLGLKYPEKSGYFAAKIDELKKKL